MSLKTEAYADALLAIDTDKPTKEQLVVLLDPLFNLLDNVGRLADAVDKSHAAHLEAVARTEAAATAAVEAPPPATGSAPQPTEPEAQAATDGTPA